MKKSLFLQTTFILMIGGLITRLLGFLIKIYYTRTIGSEGIAIYNLIMPSASLLIGLATFSMPMILSKIISEHKKRASEVAFNALYLMFFINIIIITIVILTSDYISTNLLHHPECRLLLIALSFTLPFISVSSIIKGYFFGNQKMLPYAVSNVLEQIIRFILIFSILPIILKINTYYGLIFLILISIVSESFSIFIFMFFLPTKINIKKLVIKPNLKTEKNIFNLAFFSVLGRICGSVAYFFEPIILINLLSHQGYSNSYIIYEYSLYNAYALSILTIPGFFIQALSTALIPELSKLISNKLRIGWKKVCKKALYLSLIIGIIFSTIIFIWGGNILSIIYKTSEANRYLKFLSPLFFLYYLEGPLTSIINAAGKTKKSMQITIIGSLIKLAIMSILCFAHIGIYALLIAEIVDILAVIYLDFKAIKKININLFSRSN